MAAIQLILVLLSIFPLLSSAAKVIGNTTGNLWCHVGGEKRVHDYGPLQCEPGVEECFKFVCSGGQYDFTARGCGVSILSKATGLRNQSCFQAQSVCQYIGGSSTCEVCGNKHMCNSQNAHVYIITLTMIFGWLFFL